MGAVSKTIALLILGLTAASAVCHARPVRRSLPLSPCELRSSGGLRLVKARCGRLRVPENPARPAARRIALAVAVVPAISTARRPDPLFVLAGGPGEAATTFYASVAPAFALIRRDRDIVLVDQRGTGGSNALRCGPEANETRWPSRAQIAAETERCLKKLRRHARVRFYTTDLAVQDLDRVRAALGYRRINLYGSSYGTVVAQEYIRRHPSRVRSVILDGVVPPEVAIGALSPIDAQRAVLRIFAACTRSRACRARFGNPRKLYRHVRTTLVAHAVRVALTGRAGKPRRRRFTDYELAQVLRLASYTPQLAALLPLDLHEAAAGDFVPLAGQYALINSLYGSAIADGMNSTVVCSEDVPFYHITAAQRARMRRTFLGTAPIEELEEVCKLWPHGPVSPDFHAPLHSNVPALLLSGGNDPITPPRYAAEAARGFTHSLSLVVPGFGHGQLLDPCMDQVMAQFVRRASVAGLDTACVRNLRPMPFFLTPNGPGP